MNFVCVSMCVCVHVLVVCLQVLAPMCADVNEGQ